MKTLAIPLCLLLLVSACRKVEMPKPVDSNSSMSTSRVIGDTIAPIVELRLGEHKPLTNYVGPKIPRPEHSAFRVSGDTILKASLNPGQHKPLVNSTGPVLPHN